MADGVITEDPGLWSLHAKAVVFWESIRASRGYQRRRGQLYRPAKTTNKRTAKPLGWTKMMQMILAQQIFGAPVALYAVFRASWVVGWEEVVDSSLSGGLQTEKRGVLKASGRGRQEGQRSDQFELTEGGRRVSVFWVLFKAGLFVAGISRP